MSIAQRTIENKISCVGIGLHSGIKVKLTLKPAKINTGIIFKRTDIAGEGATIAANFNNVVDTRLCTCLGDSNGHTISTIEHLMSALAGLGITNLLIEVSGAEMPILDGSSSDFVFLLACAGIKEQSAPAKMVKIRKSVTVRNGDAFVTITPSSEFNIDFTLDYSNCKTIGKEQYSFVSSSMSYADEISIARTFGLAEEIEAIRKMGLAKGGSLKNVLIASNKGIMNPEGLRINGEFVRHKILDVIGDLYTCGYAISGHVIASKSGHTLNNMLLKAIFADSANYEIADSTLTKTNSTIITTPSESLVVGE